MNCHTFYDFYLENENGREFVGKAYNTATKTVLGSPQAALRYNHYSYGPDAIQLGTGSTPPTVNDTSLAAGLGDTNDNLLTITANSWDAASDAWVIKGYKEFATSQYVGKDITEIGVFVRQYRSGWGTLTRLASRALITDSTGQPIAIHKTDTDKLVVYVTMYLKKTTYASKYLPPAASFDSLLTNLDYGDPVSGYRISPGGTLYLYSSCAKMMLVSEAHSNVVGIGLMPYTVFRTGVSGYVISDSVTVKFDNTSQNGRNITHFTYNGKQVGMPELIPIGNVDITGAILGTGDGIQTAFPIKHKGPKNISVLVDNAVQSITTRTKHKGINGCLLQGLVNALGNRFFSTQSAAVYNDILYSTGACWYIYDDGYGVTVNNIPIYIACTSKLSNGMYLPKIKAYTLDVSEDNKAQYRYSKWVHSVILHPTKPYVLINLRGQFSNGSAWTNGTYICKINEETNVLETVWKKLNGYITSYFTTDGTKLVTCTNAGITIYNVSFTGEGIVITEDTYANQETFKGVILPNAGTYLEGNTFAAGNISTNVTQLTGYTANSKVVIDWDQKSISVETLNKGTNRTVDYYVTLEGGILTIKKNTDDTVVYTANESITNITYFTQSKNWVALNSSDYSSSGPTETTLIFEIQEDGSLIKMPSIGMTPYCADFFNDIVWDNKVWRYTANIGMYYYSKVAFRGATTKYQGFGEYRDIVTEVVFNTPPLEGKTITANYQLDYIPKDENWTLELSTTTTYDLTND